MSNTNNHQSGRSVFSSQADTSFEQQFSAPSPVVALPAANIPSPAGETHRLPLDADHLDISRDPSSLPAQSKGKWPQQSTHESLPDANEEHLLHDCRVVTLVHFKIITQSVYRAYVPRPDSGSRTQASGSPSAGEAPVDPDNPQASEGLKERPRRGVWQDNDRISRDREASTQPAAGKQITRSQDTSRKSARLQNPHVDNRRTVPVQVWVHPLVKETLTCLAAAEGLSLSAAGGALLERALQSNVDMHYSALLEPIIEHAIAKHMRGISTRLAWLLVRVSIDSGQTRSLVTNILGRQTGMTTDLLRSIVKQSADTARGNITRKTPQIEDLVESVEKWLGTRERGENN